MKTRSFTWADLPALTELVSLIRKDGGDERIVSLPSLKEELGHPDLAPEENCFIFEDNEEFRAYSVLHRELRIDRTVLELGIHPGHKEGGIEAEIVASARIRSEALGARVLHICVPPSKMWENLLEEQGFSQVRNYWLMRWQEAEVSRAELPQGFAIEKFQPGDAERLTQAQNASFGGSWGFCPNTVEEVSYQAGMSISSPEGILFLAHGDNTAGYCWTNILGDPQNPVGVIGMVGIDPAYRSRGLSRPILLAGMEYLHTTKRPTT